MTSVFSFFSLVLLCLLCSLPVLFSLSLFQFPSISDFRGGVLPLYVSDSVL